MDGKTLSHKKCRNKLLMRWFQKVLLESSDVIDAYGFTEQMGELPTQVVLMKKVAPNFSRF